MSEAGTLGPLRRPDFRRFWIAHGMSALGSNLTGLALPLLILDQTGSPILAGLVGTLRMLAYLMVHLPAGALADRLRRRAVLLFTDAARALLILVIGVTLVIDRPLPIPALLALSVLGTLLSSLADPAGQAATRHIVEKDQLPSALALGTMRAQAINLAAPILGGILYQAWPALPFLVDAATFAFSFLLVSLIRSPLGGGGPALGGTLIDDILTGIRFTWNSRFLMLFLTWAALANFATAGITFALVLIVQPSGATTVGIALALVSVGGMIGASLAPRASRLRSQMLVPVIAGLRLLITCVMVIRPAPAVLAVGMTLIALLGPAASVPLNAYVFDIVPDHLMGRVQSSMTLVGGALYPFATLVTGWLMQQTSAQGAMGFLAAVLTVVFGLSLMPGLRTLDMRKSPVLQT